MKEKHKNKKNPEKTTRQKRARVQTEAIVKW